MTGKYAWKYNLAADAQKVGAELEAIYEEHGKVTPDLIVDDARQPERETHQLIEWDDTAAASQYRREQARGIMRNIVIVRQEAAAENEEQKVITLRAFENVNVEEGRYFMPLQAAMQREDTREYILRQALRELASFRHKYGQLKELASVFAAIEKTEQKYTSVQLAA